MALAVILCALCGSASAWAQDVRLRSVHADPATGTARAVVVEAGSLVHTALLYPEDLQGTLVGGRDARAQAAQVLANLHLALAAARTTLDRVVRLHVYVADASVTPAVDALIAERFRGPTLPALTVVETPMPRPGVLMAMDAIAATAWQPEPGRATRLAAEGLPRRTPRASHVAIQPEGPFVVVSGRAAPGPFEEGIRGTLDQLRTDLAGVGLTFDHVVQIKSFLGDMRRMPELEALVAGQFGEALVPPQVVTEWRQDSVAAEIELVAVGGSAEGMDGQRVAYVEPISARFSRVARVAGGRPVFTSGLLGASADPVEQVTGMFDELRTLLGAAGSDMRHLVKATYYVSDTAADQAINAIRPTIYDPQRPPAASKLAVRSVGRPGKGSTIDMIAVTVTP
jgi:enamine deaminase RidA (YjgF/YER057c/UK114 family)